MSDEINEEKLFTLTAMKLAFELCYFPFPDEYQRELDIFDESRSIFFTDDMKQAMLYIHGQFISNDKCVEYKKALRKLGLDFNLGDFLMFMGLNLYKFVYEESEEKRAQIFYGIINILKYNAPISESWIDLDEIASAYRKNTESHSIDMVEEKKFILKLIEYVFLLDFRTLPEKLQVKVNKFASCENGPFTSNVAHALAILLNNHIKDVENIDKERSVHYFLNLRYFTEREFLEFCVKQTWKALVEFFDSFDYDSLYATYKRMKRMLKGAKTEGFFTRWDKIEEAALQIIKEETGLFQNELRYQENCESKTDAVSEEYKPLRQLSDSDKSLDKSLVNQDEVVVVQPLESSSQNIEVALETPLLIEKQSSCICCKCS